MNLDIDDPLEPQGTVTSYNLPLGSSDRIAMIKEQLEALHRVHITLLKAKPELDPYYCSLCLRSTGSEQESSECHQEKVITLEEARIQVTDMMADLSLELMKIKGSSPSKGSRRRDKGDGTRTDKGLPVTIFVDNILKGTFQSAKKARKWLRNQGLTVREARKDGQNWYL